jgi:hypothetical protein
MDFNGSSQDEPNDYLNEENDSSGSPILPPEISTFSSFSGTFCSS